jgi:hypothetical protein
MVHLMATTLCVSEETRKKILILKMEAGYPSVEALLRDLIIQYKKHRLFEESARFRKRMDRKKITPEDLVE